MSDQTPGEDVVPYVGADAASTRQGIVGARVELERRRQQLRAEHERVRTELAAKRDALEAEARRMQAEIEAQMAPLKAQLEKMTEVMWTVDLYLGRGEEIELIRDGEPAPADTPIAVRQKVLVMAEESLVLMDDGDTGVDAERIPEFISWLCADDANLDRVLPEKKGVIVLVPTRVKVRSGNVFEDSYRNEANSQSYWLIRNGSRLYLLTVDEQLTINDRILPLRREFVEVFDQRTFGFGRTEPVRPGSDEWFKLEKVADARRRHYMRLMLILQGLVDRTPVWHPLPPTGVNFMSIRDQDAGKVQLIHDAEESTQLGEAREDFSTWLRRMNALLRPGLRIIGDWSSAEFRELREDRYGHRHPRLFPETVDSVPATGVPHLIEGRRDGGFVIRYSRTDKVYRRNVPVEGEPGYVWSGERAVDAKVRASCVVKPGDTWVLPLDVVSIPDLERFLASRDERSKHFLSMVPLMRAAIAAKRAEAEQEADFRDLIGRLLIMEGAEATTVTALVEDLVHWWKLAHAWTKPLNGDGAHEKKAADQILAEYRSRQRATRDDSAAIVAAGKQVRGAIAVARDRQGRWFAYAQSADALEPGVFLDVTRIYRDGTVGETQPWRILATRTAAALQVAWSTEEWDDWKHGKNPRHYLTGPERSDLIQETLRRAEGPAVAVVELWNPKAPDSRVMQVWWWAVDRSPSEMETVASTDIIRDRESTHFGNRDVTPLLASRAWTIERGEEPNLGAVSRAWEISHHFRHYSGGSRWGETPWWPEEAPGYGDARPKLVWSDEALLDEIAAWVGRCGAAQAELQAAARATEIEARRYVKTMYDAVRAAQLAPVREAFEMDFGHDAEDLWDAHLATLRLPDRPIGEWDLVRVVVHALNAGQPVAGRTLRSLADDHAEGVRARRRDRPFGYDHRDNIVNVGEFGDVIFPEPEAKEPSDG